VYEYALTDTNTNRKIRCMAVLTEHTLYRVSALQDALGTESSFTKEFFESFTPERKSERLSVFSGKGNRFAADLESSDSSTQKIARSAISLVAWEGSRPAGIETGVQRHQPRQPGLPVYQNKTDTGRRLYTRYSQGC
jgi:hypothetical protein